MMVFHMHAGRRYLPVLLCFIEHRYDYYTILNFCEKIIIFVLTNSILIVIINNNYQFLPLFVYFLTIIDFSLAILYNKFKRIKHTFVKFF